MLRYVLILASFLLLHSCAPKEPVILREVHIRKVDMGSDGKNPILTADAILFNPNKGSLRLKEIDLDIMVNDKPAARIDQQLNSKIKAQSEFTVPLEVQLKLTESGLLDTILQLFGSKKYAIRFTGKVKVKVGGFPVSIPVDHSDEIKF